jgi:hypothetical protein
MQKLTSPIALLAPPFEISQEILEKIFCLPECPTLAQVEFFWQEMKTYLLIPDPNNLEDTKTLASLPLPEFQEPLQHGCYVSLHILSDWGEGVYVVSRH